jgi:DNA-binding LacI/PurR family transcriptional regulator
MKNSLPMYLVILNDLRAKIESGIIKVGHRLPSEAELSAQWGVSRITSRRALNDLAELGFATRFRGAGTFSADPREVDLPKQGGGKRSRPVLSLVLPFATQLGRSIDLFHGVRESADRRGYVVNLISSDRDVEKERTILRSQIHSYSEGVVLYPINDAKNLDVYLELELNSFPVVMIDKNVAGIRSAVILSDNQGGSRSAVEHLVDCGHRRITFVTDTNLGAASSVRDRFLGYSRALSESGFGDCVQLFDYSESLNRSFPAGWEGIYQPFLLDDNLRTFFRATLRQILASPTGVPTALVAVNDYVAILLMRAAILEGLKVPQDLSIIGFDNIELASQLEIPLTTVDQDFHGIGALSADLLIDSIEEKSPSAGVHLLPTRLLLRDSVARFPSPSPDLSSYTSRR